MTKMIENIKGGRDYENGTGETPHTGAGGGLCCVMLSLEGGLGVKKTRDRFLAASITVGTCRARTYNLRGKGLTSHPLDHRVSWWDA